MATRPQPTAPAKRGAAPLTATPYSTLGALAPTPRPFDLLSAAEQTLIRANVREFLAYAAAQRALRSAETTQAGPEVTFPHAVG